MKTTGKIFALFLISAFLFAACIDEKPCVVGSGSVQEYPLNISGFNEVSLSGAMDLLLKEDPTHDAAIVAEPEIYAVIDHDLYGERLDIEMEKGVTCIQTSEGILVKLAAPVLHKIDVSGESEIRSDGDIDESDLELDVSGVADVKLTGTATYQKIDVAGMVTVANFDLHSETVEIDISGSGTLEVYAETELNIRVSGDATIYYKGNPQINQNVSGRLELINAN